MTVQQLINKLTEIVKVSPEKADVLVFAFPEGLRVENDLEELEEENIYEILSVDDDISDRVDLNF